MSKKTRIIGRYKFFLLLPFILFLSACVTLQDPEATQEYHSEVIAELQPGQTFGQTFTSNQTNISSIVAWLKGTPDPSQKSGRLFVELFRHPGDEKPLFQTAYDLANLTKQDSITIPFSKSGIDLLAGKYYLQLKTEGGNVSISGKNEDAYAKGVASINGMPIDADMGFRVNYSYNISSALEDLKKWFGQIWLIFPLLITLWLPGRILLRLSNFDRRLDWGERTASSVGLSLAIVPLLMLWTTQLGLNWGRLSIGIIAGLLIVCYILLLHPLHWKLDRIREISISWPSLGLAVIFIFSLAIRLAMIRDMAGPAWVDSVHHALLGRMILEDGGFPATYAPYLQVSTAHYHVGYHSALATFIWLSGLDLARAVLVFGQFLNALAVIAVYLLTVTFTRRPIAGIFAALICGLMTPMPAYYTSWGRYTELAGLLILPVAFLFIKKLFDQPLPNLPLKNIKSDTWSLIGLACLSVAGLLLVHYRVLAFLVCLVGAYVFIELFKAIIQHNFRKTLVKALITLSIITGIALILTVLWWPATLRSFVLPVARDTGTGEAFSDFSWTYLTAALGKYALGLAGLGLIWSFIQRKTFGLVQLFWVLGMFLLANLGYFHLPGASFINNTSVAIMLFMPTALLGGYLLDWVVEGWSGWVPQVWKPVYWIAISLATIVLLFISARALLPILNTGTLLLRKADLPAIQWISENTPSDAKFIINPFNWGYGVYAGNDGGYWIMPVTGRSTLPPPALYGYDFTGGIVKRISDNARKVQDLVKDPAGLHALMKEEGIDYIFIGARGGVLSLDILKQSSAFTEIYNQNGVHIFKAN